MVYAAAGLLWCPAWGVIESTSSRSAPRKSAGCAENMRTLEAKANLLRPHGRSGKGRLRRVIVLEIAQQPCSQRTRKGHPVTRAAFSRGTSGRQNEHPCTVHRVRHRPARLSAAKQKQ